MGTEPLSAAAAEAALFGDALAFEGAARVAIVGGALPAGALEDAEHVLRGIATIEDRRGDEGDSATPADPALRRVEAKLDLTLQLLVHALPSLRGPPPQPAKLSARGLRLALAQHDDGEPALLRWQPSETLPLTVHLPMHALARDASTGWWGFATLPAELAEALERHVFRLHRRALAARRRG